MRTRIKIKFLTLFLFEIPKNNKIKIPSIKKIKVPNGFKKYAIFFNKSIYFSPIHSSILK